ncbi:MULTISPECIES: hypothetical protein [Planktothrix]|uniref:Transposase n=1 Tax=Planktothrix mougeotii LEGE 06226 TaxID=1828728 RepID=A0ABR9UDI0_9CYAN|nr:MULTISPECIES: hypothetical protein [Planktothrix]MBD2485063.1 hypothetical protein [Planktothrix sp. FACHB-1365]MBE9144531.1 hypothetical protein [Planktothrix mougeotii LEGE 06226]
MVQLSPSLVDERGIIRKALTLLPPQLRGRFLEVLAELQDESCYRYQRFFKTKLKRIKGIQIPLYCARIDDAERWKLYLYYQEGKLYLQDIICPLPKANKDSLDIIAELNDF